MISSIKKLEYGAILSIVRGYYKDAEMFTKKLQQEKNMDTQERWNVTISYKVEGKEIYSDTQTWQNIKPEKVGIMMKLLKEAQEKFIKAASTV